VARDRPAWITVIFTENPAVIGAIRRSERLRWTSREAKEDAEGWIREMGFSEPIAWRAAEPADGKHMLLIGHVPNHTVVVGSVRLPRGKPPSEDDAEFPG
jgi:hypothetical protein